MPVAPEPGFRLTPEEDFVFGVKLRGASLSFGPSGTEVFASGVLWALTLAAGGFMVLAPDAASIWGNTVGNTGAVVVFGLVTIAHGTWLFLAALRTGVTADDDGVTLRRFVHREQIPWSDIQGFLPTETPPRRWSRFIGTDSVGWRRRSVESWSIGVVRRRGGKALRLPGFVSAARADGLSLGAPTATELKVAALARYRIHLGRDAVDGSAQTTPHLIEEDHHSWRWAAANVAGTVLVWLLTSWAVGGFINPMFVIAGVAAACIELIRRR